MDKKIISDVMNEIDCLGNDLEKIRTIANEGFELLTPVYDKDTDERMKAYDLLQKQPTLTTFFSIIMDYTEKINQALEQSAETLQEQIKESKGNGNKENKD